MNGLWWLAALGALVGLGVALEIADRRMNREAQRLDDKRSARRLRDEMENHP